MEKNLKMVRNITITCVVIIMAIFIYFYKKNTLKRIVEENRQGWDLLALQNTLEDGDYMGKIYEKSYTATTFPKDFLSVLAINYYMSNGNFYEEENMIDYNSFQKTVSKQDFDDIVKKMFGPDVYTEVEEIEYGCNISLKKNGNQYIITASIPDVCGVSTANDEFYLSHISNYYKKNNDIIIHLKVGYIEINTTYDDEYDEENVTYTLYKDKTKQNILQKDYNSVCISEDSDKTCYEQFDDYEVTLKKASDKKYYFYSINKK